MEFTHTHMRTHAHTHTHVCTYAHVHMHVPYTLPCNCMNTCSHTLTHMQLCTHIYTCKQVHTHVGPPPHTHTFTICLSPHIRTHETLPRSPCSICSLHPCSQHPSYARADAPIPVCVLSFSRQLQAKNNYHVREAAPHP